MSHHRARTVISCLAAFAVLLAGCGASTGTTASPSIAASAAPATSSPVVTASPKPTVTASPRPTVAPSASAPSTAKLPRSGRIEITTAGYAVTLPDNWFRIELSKDDVEAFVKSGSSQFAEGAGEALTSQIASFAAGQISLFAYRFADKKAALGTNLNVLVLPALSFDLDTIEGLNIGQLKAILGTKVVIKHVRVTLPAGEATRISYTIPATAGTSNQSFSIIQHLMVAGGRQVILTCSAPGSITKIAPECDGIAKSLELLGS